MTYVAYYCAEGCDGKACIVLYPSGMTPKPKKCVISDSLAEWKLLNNLNVEKNVEEVDER